MKKVALVLIAIVLLAVIGVGIFIATFDLDRYRPLVTQEFQKALGRPVTLGRLKLGWEGGLAVQAQQIAVLESETAQSAPLIEIEQVSALVRMQPLLRKEVQVASVVIERPVIRASRDAQGRINLIGPSVAAASVAAPSASAASTGSAAAPPMRFEIDAVRIEHGTVLWKDAAANPPVELTLSQLDIDVRHIAPGRPMDVSARGALGGDRQNLSVTGRVLLPAGQTPLTASELHIELTDPPLELFMPNGAPPPVPVKSVAVSVPQFTLGQPVDLKVSAAVAGDQPNVEFSGRVQLPDAQAPGRIDQMRLTIRQIALAAVAPPPKSPKDPRVRGTVSATLEGALSLDPAQMLRQFSGRGKLQVADAVVENLNVVQEIFKKLAMLPGLVERLRSRLPPEYQAKLDAKDTKFEPIDANVTIDRGVLRVPELVIQSDTFGIFGIGPIDLAGPVSTQARVRLDPDFSLAIIRSVSELQALSNAKGEMEIPLTLTSAPPHVLPDLQYIASRVISTKVNDFLGELLRGDEAQPEQAPAQPAPGGAAAPQGQPGQPAQPAQPPSGEALIGQFLQRVLQPPPAQGEPDDSDSP